MRIAGVSHRRAVRALRRAGFWVLRESKHTVMTDGERILTIPRANPINARTLGGIVESAGLTAAQFRRLL